MHLPFKIRNNEFMLVNAVKKMLRSNRKEPEIIHFRQVMVLVGIII